METQSPIPPPQPNASRSRSCSATAIVNLVLRAFASVLLFIALILLTTASVTVLEVDSSADYTSTTEVHFNHFYAYRYTLYTILIGMVYTLLQTALAIFRLATGKLLSPILLQFDFYADKFVSYTLATGAAAAFGMTIDAKRYYGRSSFWDKTDASASLLLLGFVCSAVSSVFSSLALSKYK